MPLPFKDDAAALHDPMPGPPCLTGEMLKAALRKSVLLSSLENIIKLDDDPFLRKAAKRRYLDLTGPEART